MTKNQKKIRKLAIEILKESFEEQKKLVDKAVTCGALDTENWSEFKGPYRIPKTIVSAVLERQAGAYAGARTTFEKQIKREIKNLKYFI